MKTIQLTKNTKEIITYYGEPFDVAVNNLIDKVEDYMPFLDYSKDNSISTANVEEITRDRIKSFALSDGESYENILIRMLIISQALNSKEF